MHSTGSFLRFVSGLVFVGFLGASSAGCARAALSPAGAQVTIARNPPPSDCVSIKYLVGRGGGTFGGKYIANENLIAYAMNDVRNQAADVGANYVQSDPPQLGNGNGSTTTATITGTAYRCTGPTTPTLSAQAQ